VTRPPALLPDQHGHRDQHRHRRHRRSRAAAALHPAGPRGDHRSRGDGARIGTAGTSLSLMAVRLEPHDEYMHELGPEANFNESMYFNIFDPTTRIGGFFRLGNRANEGYAEIKVCVYLPDGR